ncbi:MAG: SMP-30/gluconolactonase/LRE family protein [Gemmatimonadota bacterium]
MPYQLLSGEPVSGGLRRIAAEQIEKALQSLEGRSGEDRETAVHSARKCMKRLRAVLRLVRDDLGREAYQLENGRYRDAAARLGGLRDATVMLETLAGLEAWLGPVPPLPAAGPLRAWLEQARQQEYEGAGSMEAAAAEVCKDLRQALGRLEAWPLRRRGWDGLAGGLRRTYARGRTECADAFWQPGDEVFHDWRKRAKYLWYHCQIIAPVWAAPMAVLVEELDGLGDGLGKDHDLAVLAAAVRSGAGARAGLDDDTQLDFQRAVARWRAELQGRCQVLAQRVYAEAPRAFVRRLRRYWEAWGEEQLQSRAGDPATPATPAPAAAPASKRREMEPELIADYACKTGEGPLWHPDEKRLYWVDIPRGRMFRYDPAKGTHEQFYEGEVVGGFTIQQDGALLLFMARGAIAIWREGQPLDYVVKELPHEGQSRFNDVIADPAGRVFCGTMPSPDHLGRLYRLDGDGAIAEVLTEVGCANGMGFTADRRRMYFTDSPTRRIDVFDYDEETGALRNRRPFVDMGGEEGIPDGMTVDAEGGVWGARWDGSCLVRYTPDGREDRRIQFPARKVSSASFGGEDYGDLFVTTAGGDDKSAEGAGAGALFRLRPGVHGVAEYRSRILL